MPTHLVPVGILPYVFIMFTLIKVNNFTTFSYGPTFTIPRVFRLLLDVRHDAALVQHLFWSVLPTLLGAFAFVCLVFVALELGPLLVPGPALVQILLPSPKFLHLLVECEGHLVADVTGLP